MNDGAVVSWVSNFNWFGCVSFAWVKNACVGAVSSRGTSSTDETPNPVHLVRNEMVPSESPARMLCMLTFVTNCGSEFSQMC